MIKLTNSLTLIRIRIKYVCHTNLVELALFIEKYSKTFYSQTQLHSKLHQNAILLILFIEKDLIILSIASENYSIEYSLRIYYSSKFMHSILFTILFNAALELNTVDIFNIHDKLLDDNTTIEFCKTSGRLRHTPQCAVHFTEQTIL